MYRSSEDLYRSEKGKSMIKSLLRLQKSLNNLNTKNQKEDNHD